MARLFHRTLTRSTDLDGRLLHYSYGIKGRPFRRFIRPGEIEDFAGPRAVFEVETQPGKPDRYLRRVD
ncbi:MAG: hypothetical protein JWM33_263 [Caulobacteraceae bacterium]|nr:hypothetical protein [Caulobacteraceae bacterium]